MVFSVSDDGLSIKLSEDFVKEMKKLIQKEREINNDAIKFYNATEKQCQEINERLDLLELRLNSELLSQQSRSQIKH